MKAKLTIIKNSNGHKVLDDLKIPYRLNGNRVFVSMNAEELERFNEEVNVRAEKFFQKIILPNVGSKQ